jgi:MoaA/NifB/PqqE/SkfB family radical SAM enzyme
MTLKFTEKIRRLFGIRGIETIIRYPRIAPQVFMDGVRRRLFGIDAVESALIKKPRITVLFLYANSVCNAHCSMCDVAADRSGAFAKNLKGTPKNMSLSLLEKILFDPLIKGRKIPIVFAMTEPLLNKELPKMLELCKKEDRMVRVITNGSRLAKRAHEISPYIDSVQVSLDGPKAIHDSIRGKDFFDKAIEGIKKLRELNSDIDIDINFTVFNTNYTCLYNFVKEIDQLGVRLNMKIQLMQFISGQMAERHNVQFPDIPQTVSSLGDGENLININAMELSRQLELVKSYKPKFIDKIAFKPNMFSAKYLEEYYNLEGKIIPGIDKCTAPYREVAIDTSGNVFWHTRCYSDYILGNVNHEPLKQIFYGAKAKHFRERFLKNGSFFPACARCCGVMPVDFDL